MQTTPPVQLSVSSTSQMRSSASISYRDRLLRSKTPQSTRGPKQEVLSFVVERGDRARITQAACCPHTVPYIPSKTNVMIVHERKLTLEGESEWRYSQHGERETVCIYRRATVPPFNECSTVFLKLQPATFPSNLSLSFSSLRWQTLPCLWYHRQRGTSGIQKNVKGAHSDQPLGTL